MNSRHWLFLIWLLAGIGLPAACRAAERPNILILMADNWAYPHAGIYGDRVVRTPTFDRIAREGMFFRNAFCLVPSCAPARAAFLTGQTIHRLDDAANLHGRFPAQHRVFTEALEEAGYFVGFSGKGWGPGNVKESGRTRNPAGTKFDDVNVFLQELPRDKPFCYWHSSKNPHIPWSEGAEHKAAMNRAAIQVPQYLPDVPTVRESICDYLCEVQRFDQECAAILQALSQAGRLDDTLIVMIGDNGWQMPHGLAHIYDAGTRVPLAIAWGRQLKISETSPATEKPASKPVVGRDEFVNFDDFAPTFLEVAGLKPFEACTGKSLLPLIQGQADTAVRDAVFLSRERHANVRRGNRSYPVRAIRTRDFLYVRNFEPDLWPAGDPEVYFAVGDFGDIDGTPTKQFILDHRNEPGLRSFFDMNFGKRPAEELYDLRSDPDQTKNVVADERHSQSKRQLAARLAEWMRQTNDPRLMNPHDNRWDKAPYYGNRAKVDRSTSDVGTQAPLKLFDGQPTRLFFSGNSHHPTFGREKLTALLNRYFDGKSPIVVDGLEDARKDPLTKQPIKPAKVDDLLRFLEPVFAEREKQSEPRERLVVLNFVIVESPRSKPRPDWVREDADALQRYAEAALQRGASAIFFSEMVQPNFIQGGKNGNRFRREGLQVFDELESRRLPGIHRGPTLQVLMEDQRHLFNDDRHFSPQGRDYIACRWFETLLQHDNLPTPDWLSANQ